MLIEKVLNGVFFEINYEPKNKLMLKCHFEFHGHDEVFSGLPVVLLLLSALLISCSSSNSVRKGTLSKSEVSSLMIQRKASEYSIQPGDRIEISVWGYDEFNTQKTVTSQGIITVPLVGEIEAEGMNKEQFKKDLEEELAEYIKGDINLSVTISSPQRNIVSVLGSVGRPDNYPVVNNSSLFEILSKAGGATEQADLRSIKIYRNGEARLPVEVDLTNYLKQGNTQTLAVVSPGDIVYVPQKDNVLRELSGFIRDVVLLFGLFRVFN